MREPSGLKLGKLAIPPSRVSCVRCPFPASISQISRLPSDPESTAIVRASGLHDGCRSSFSPEVTRFALLPSASMTQIR